MRAWQPLNPKPYIDAAARSCLEREAVVEKALDNISAVCDHARNLNQSMGWATAVGAENRCASDICR